MAKMSFNRNYDISRVVKKLVYTILSLYVGGTIITVFGNVMNGTASPFYEGMQLIGWTVTDNVNGTASVCSDSIVTTSEVNNCITDTSGSGVLAVLGIIALASVVLEFISFK